MIFAHHGRRSCIVNYLALLNIGLVLMIRSGNLWIIASKWMPMLQGVLALIPWFFLSHAFSTPAIQILAVMPAPGIYGLWGCSNLNSKQFGASSQSWDCQFGWHGPSLDFRKLWILVGQETKEGNQSKHASLLPLTQGNPEIAGTFHLKQFIIWLIKYSKVYPMLLKIPPPKFPLDSGVSDYLDLFPQWTSCITSSP